MQHGLPDAGQPGTEADGNIAVQGSAVQRISDVGLGVAIPWHSHMAMNSVITDYVPKGPIQSALESSASPLPGCSCILSLSLNTGSPQTPPDGAHWQPQALPSSACCGSTSQAQASRPRSCSCGGRTRRDLLQRGSSTQRTLAEACALPAAANRTLCLLVSA